MLDSASAKTYVLCNEASDEGLTEMKHTIETSGATQYRSNVTRVKAIAAEIASVHAGCEFVVDDEGIAIRIIAKCNGAALRDLVEALDKSGYLE